MRRALCRMSKLASLDAAAQAAAEGAGAAAPAERMVIAAAQQAGSADDLDSGAAEAEAGATASVSEGRATIFFPSEKGVFYNPPQIPNRDLSVLVLHEFAETWTKEVEKKRADALARKAAKINNASSCSERAEENKEGCASVDAISEKPKLRVLDAMTASGLRAIRYSLEVPQVTQVVANDLQPTALSALRENLRRNGLTEDQVVPNLGDAVSVMSRSKPPEGDRFEVIELDPYGTAAPFLDSAMQSVAEGGLLMATCTDLAVLCGTYPEACHAKYGSYCLKGKYCHEAALRIVLSCMEAHANRHRRYIVPLVSVHINFYVRVCVRVYTSATEVKKAPTKKATIYQCSGCDTFTLQPLAKLVVKGNSEKISPAQGPPVDRRCEHCGFVHHIGGPIWTEPTSDRNFVARLLAKLEQQTDPLVAALGSRKRLVGMLTAVHEELPDVPLFLQLAQMCSVLHSSCPPLVGVISALMRQGYRVSRSHTDPGAIKTNAAPRALWDVLRCWDRKQSRSKPLSEHSPAYRILAQAPLVEADFTPTPEAEALLAKRDADGIKLGRFLPNPDEWGPGSRGTSHANFAPFTGEAAPSVSVAGGGSSKSMPLPSAMLDKRARNQNKRARKRQARETSATGAGFDDSAIQDADQIRVGANHGRSEGSTDEAEMRDA